jgi:hypothetical protein
LHEVAKQINIISNDIESIERATGFQMHAFKASLLPERGYMNFLTFTFAEPVETHRLEHACEMLVARHGALRTVFVEHNGDLFQVVTRHRLCDGPKLQLLGIAMNRASDRFNLEIPRPGYAMHLVKFSFP